jgi:hypothetical protein
MCDLNLKEEYQDGCICTARAMLPSIGFSFVGFTIGMLGMSLLTSWHIAVMGSYLGGSDAQETAVKATINAFIGTAPIVTVTKFGLCLLDQPFLILTAVLGITAISLALMKS